LRQTKSETRNLQDIKRIEKKPANSEARKKPKPDHRYSGGGGSSSGGTSTTTNFVIASLTLGGL